MIRVLPGDCRTVLATLPADSIDAVVTDPPYHLTSIVERFGASDAAPAKFGTDGAFSRMSTGFMGKQLDGDDVALAARRLFCAIRRDRDDLFRFITRRDVPYTNNACERALRPSVIFRKVTGGFRAEWGAKVYAAAASVIATGRLYRLTALAALRAALAGEPVMRPG